MQEVKLYEEIYNTLDGNVIIGGNPVTIYTYIPRTEVPVNYIRLVGFIDSFDDNKCARGEQKLFNIEIVSEDTNKLNFYSMTQQVKDLLYPTPTNSLPLDPGFQNVWMQFDSSDETPNLPDDAVNVFINTLRFRFAVKELT